MQLPVMFWIYGGAFSSGSNNLYGMERIGDVADVIMVAVNYRLGALGIYLLLQSRPIYFTLIPLCS